MKRRVLALFLAAAWAGWGADWEFDHLVRSIENHYGVRRTHIPLLGVANFFVKTIRPAGARGFKLAVFERFEGAGDEELDRFVDAACQGGLHPLVVTHSRRDGEASYVLAGDVGKSTKLLIATFERNEATVVEVRVDMARVLKMIGERAAR